MAYTGPDPWAEKTYREKVYQHRKKEREEKDKEKKKQTIGDMLKQTGEHNIYNHNPYANPFDHGPTAENPYGRPTTTRTEVEMRRKLGNQMKETYQKQADQAMLDALKNGIGIKQFNLDPLAQPTDDLLNYEDILKLDEQMKQKPNPYVTTDYGTDYDKTAFTQEFKLPTYEKMLVELFKEDPALIENLSLMADDENVSVMSIIIFILNDYLTPIHHT